MNELELYQSRRKLARIAGAFYVVLALAMFPDMLRRSLIVADDAATTGQNILANALLFRLSIFGDLVCYVAFVFLAIWLYSLLKDVHREAAWLMVAFVLVATSIAMLSASNELTALALLQDNDAVQAMLFLGLYKNGILIAEIFMGLWLFPLGWLFFKSGFMPKTLGILLMVGCFGYLADSFAGLVMPDWRALTQMGVMLPAMAELATVFWLLVFGVKRPAKEKLTLVAA
jgi:Domain of unknown function (DUF4386)